MNASIDSVKEYYSDSYKKLGLGAQRRYPSEELCRFVERHFHDVPLNKRTYLKFLETGCGSGGNLWMIAKEGFETYGTDLCPEAIHLCEQTLINYGVQAQLSCQNMANLNYPDSYFDIIVDVFSSFCLTKQEHLSYLQGIKKILKKSGLFFSYFPSKSSDAYQFPGESYFIDSDTLSAISRKDCLFYGEKYPFRFMHPREYANHLTDLGMRIRYLETTSTTYHMGQETFCFIVIEAAKIDD